MIDPAESIIQSVSVHHVGNAGLEHALKLSDAPLEIDDDRVAGLLKTYFLSSFNTPEYFTFSSGDGDFTSHPVFKIASDIIEEPGTLHENSVRLAEALYEASQHPAIKEGELFVAYFSALAINGQHTEALGIFKCENKESFLKLKAYANQFDLVSDEGINVRKLDKGCLILNLEKDSGFKVLIVDNANRTDAQFWKENFLRVTPWSDAYHRTQQYMNMTRDFVANKISEEFNVSKADQIDLLNKSVNFFKSKDQFNQAEFEEEVLGNEEIAESFRHHSRTFLANADVDIEDNFEISAPAVQRQAKVFKSVLKLDKNFHIYIHGDRQLIEKGFDERVGKHFYKIYFDHES